eukprot:3666313-Pyramimonas_sp.AAC.2
MSRPRPHVSYIPLKQATRGVDGVERNLGGRIKFSSGRQGLLRAYGGHLDDGGGEPGGGHAGKLPAVPAGARGGVRGQLCGRGAAVGAPPAARLLRHRRSIHPPVRPGVSL